MKEIMKSRLPFRRMVLPKEEAISVFPRKAKHYKVELINALDDDEVSSVLSGRLHRPLPWASYSSLGIHQGLQAYQVAGAYWRGDERNPMLQRIYGTAFPSKDDLKQYLQLYRGGQEAGSPQAGQRAGPVFDTR